MALVIPNQFGVLTLRWIAENDPEEMVSTLGYGAFGTNPDDVVAIAAGFNSDWKAAFPASAFSSRYTYKGVRIQHRPAAGGDLIEAEITENIVGTGTSNPLPSNTALLVRKTSSIGGRKHKGRMYIPPWWLPEVNIDSNGRMISVDVASLQTRFTAFFDATLLQTEPNVAPVVLHSAAITPPTVIEALVVQDQVATQRRRMRS